VSFFSYAAELKDQMPVCWAYWIPLQAITFSVVPAHLRVAFVSLGATGYGRLTAFVEVLNTTGRFTWCVFGVFAVDSWHVDGARSLRCLCFLFT
jgi:hypothetical protein